MDGWISCSNNELRTPTPFFSGLCGDRGKSESTGTWIGAFYCWILWADESSGKLRSEQDANGAKNNAKHLIYRR